MEEKIKGTRNAFKGKKQSPLDGCCCRFFFNVDNDMDFCAVDAIIRAIGLYYATMHICSNDVITLKLY